MGGRLKNLMGGHRRSRSRQSQFQVSSHTRAPDIAAEGHHYCTAERFSLQVKCFQRGEHVSNINAHSQVREESKKKNCDLIRLPSRGNLEKQSQLVSKMSHRKKQEV